MTDLPLSDQTPTTLSAKLWAFALRCYAKEKESLLTFQETAGLHINDAIFMGFTVTESRTPDYDRWRLIREGCPRLLLLRLRRYRQQMSRSHPGRPTVLEWELAMEAWDLHRLASCLPLQTGAGSSRWQERIDAAAVPLVEHSAIDRAEAISLIQRLVLGGSETR